MCNNSLHIYCITYIEAHVFAVSFSQKLSWLCWWNGTRRERERKEETTTMSAILWLSKYPFIIYYILEAAVLKWRIWPTIEGWTWGARIWKGVVVQHFNWYRHPEDRSTTRRLAALKTQHPSPILNEIKSIRVRVRFSNIFFFFFFLKLDSQ